MINLGSDQLTSILEELAIQFNKELFLERLEKLKVNLLYANENALGHVFVDDNITSKQTILDGLNLLLIKSYEIRHEQSIKEIPNEK